ncbi:hypothetical protein RRSWK_06881 [Rhodopirellula sp. SWK7]|nr:hypothetical protein RRSWK_06881 [Rhodopirellula sp. SWK7]
MKLPPTRPIDDWAPSRRPVVRDRWGTSASPTSRRFCVWGFLGVSDTGHSLSHGCG